MLLYSSFISSVINIFSIIMLLHYYIYNLKIIKKKKQTKLKVGINELSFSTHIGRKFVTIFPKPGRLLQLFLIKDFILFLALMSFNMHSP